jgi:cholesterol transport system auxiliary component
MRGGARLSALALLLASALAGCALAPSEPASSSFLLDQLPRDVPQRARSATTLLVFAPDARPSIDTTQMAYTVRPHEQAYFAHNQWAEAPPQMLQPLLLRTLEATGAFSAVVAPPHRTTSTLGLRTEIVDLVQDFAHDPPVLRFVLRVRLSDEAANRVLGTREIRIEQAMKQRTPAAGVEAANEATASALRELAAFVLEKAP